MLRWLQTFQFLTPSSHLSNFFFTFFTSSVWFWCFNLWDLLYAAFSMLWILLWVIMCLFNSATYKQDFFTPLSSHFDYFCSRWYGKSISMLDILSKLKTNGILLDNKIVYQKARLHKWSMWQKNMWSHCPEM